MLIDHIQWPTTISDTIIPANSVVLTDSIPFPIEFPTNIICIFDTFGLNNWAVTCVGCGVKANEFKTHYCLLFRNFSDISQTVGGDWMNQALVIGR